MATRPEEIRFDEPSGEPPLQPNPFSEPCASETPQSYRTTAGLMAARSPGRIGAEDYPSIDRMNEAPQSLSFERATKGRVRAQLVASAGAVIILLSLAAALLPLADGLSRTSVIRTMMVAAGLVEMIAGSVRARSRFAAMLPGAATVAAGLLFTVEPFGAFVPTVRLVIGWLAARGLLLALTSLDVRGSVRFWTILGAATDLSLSAILHIGLTASTIAIIFFGPTPEIIGSFAWVLALSFIATGMLLLEVAACEDR